LILKAISDVKMFSLTGFLEGAASNMPRPNKNVVIGVEFLSVKKLE
jgi:hypothetical protein